MVEGTSSAAQTMPQEQQTRGRHAARREKDEDGLARSSLLMAGGTVVSRATGLIRQVLQAAALGTGLLASTYNTANTVPTSLYTLLIGGALNAVLVPQLVRARASNSDGGRAYEQRLVTLVVCVLGVGTALAVWAAPQIVDMGRRAGRGRRRVGGATELICRFPSTGGAVTAPRDASQMRERLRLSRPSCT